MSSFSGKIKEYPQISVDRFDGRHLASTAYFLSHHHSDHMHGLSSPQFLDHMESNSGVYLYCSLITARFLETNIRYRPLSPYIHPLQVEESVKVTIPNIAEDASQYLWVTLIPAAHCPGSIMFLFEGRGGTILYTGDFRMSIGEAARIRPLHNSDGGVKTIDHLHIDTTFCHKDIMQFPNREDSCTALMELVEDWLARGNNFLIHLIFPARYGYEFLFRGLHERFSMKIHVSRWKYRMYASVPEILELLTLDATETWIHACDWRANEADEGNDNVQRHLPCRCVPYGVDVEPNIRVIKPSAIYYTMYQSAKEIKQVSPNGTFCRILLSMHASCSELLDLVSYLRPRKVSPTVIPYNSTREQVLKLLHEALNRSGDHYSIEYVSNQRPNLAPSKRRLETHDSSCAAASASSSILEAGMLDSFMSSPSKRRRHSDSNMTLVIRSPRGNMKGSLSLEGECRPHEPTNDGSMDQVFQEPFSPAKESSTSTAWMDPYTPSPSLDVSPKLKEGSLSPLLFDENRQLSSNIVKCASSEKPSTSTNITNVQRDDESPGPYPLKANESQDSIEMGSVFSEEEDVSVVDSERPSSSAGVAGESSIKKSRRLWYKHKYFSTPVHEDIERSKKLGTIGPRSSSLPLPETIRRSLFATASTDINDDQLPLITVSSPSDNSVSTGSEIGVPLLVLSGDSVEEDSPLEVQIITKNPDWLDKEAVKSFPRHNQDEPMSSNPCKNQRPSVICAPRPGDNVNQFTNPNGLWIDCNLPKWKTSLKRSRQTTTPKFKRTKLSTDIAGIEVVNLESHKNPSTCEVNDVSPTDDTSARSSCLKTTKRHHDQIQVISLERSPL